MDSLIRGTCTTVANRNLLACPSCGGAMSAHRLESRLGTQVPIDVCRTCQLIWFDRLESVKLSPGSTLRLFRLIGERPPDSPQPIAAPLKCPRCRIRLLATQDRQRNTRFRYWRCGRDHGRLITFFDFLREKDFIKPLSPQQVTKLRANVQTLNCSNCGAPIDLSRESACAHCSSPISMLDLEQVERVVDELRAKDEAAKTTDPTLSLKLELEKLEVETLFEGLRADGMWNCTSRFGLVEAGLWFLSRKLN